MKHIILISFILFTLFKAQGSFNTFLHNFDANDNQLDAFADITSENYQSFVLLNLLNPDDDEEIRSGDELGIRAGGEPPLRTGEKAGNTILGATKMRFKIPDMNA